MSKSKVSRSPYSQPQSVCSFPQYLPISRDLLWGSGNYCRRDCFPTSRVLLLPWVHLCATAATLSQVIYVFNREVGSLGVIQCMSRSFRLGYFDFINQRHVVSDGIPAWYHVSRRKEFADKPSHSVLPPPPRYPNGSLYTGYPPGVIIETNNTLTHHEGPEYQLVVGEGA